MAQLAEDMGMDVYIRQKNETMTSRCNNIQMFTGRGVANPTENGPEGSSNG